MVAFCSTVQILPLIVLNWKSRLWVDFKLESMLHLSLHQQAWRKKVLCISVRKWEELHVTLNNSKSEYGQGYYKDKTKNLFKVTRVRVIEYEFLRVFDFWNAFDKGFRAVSFFEYSSYRKSTVFIKFAKFSPQI